MPLYIRCGYRKFNYKKSSVRLRYTAINNMTIEMRVFVEIDADVYSEDEFEMVKESVLIGDGTLKLISENVTDEDDYLPQVIGTITAVTNVKLDR